MTAGSRIINTASQAAFQPLPYFSVYAASKAFIDRFSMALAVELKPRGIAVTSVCPSWMRTPFLIKAKTDTHPSVIRPFPITDPAWVAARALADSRKGKFRSIYGILTRISGWVAKLLSQNLIMMLWLMQQGWSGGSAFQRSCLREAKLAEEAKLRLKLLERHQDYD
ncbi:SDR family NAD(P)-dependent oxidoreductase [Holdemania massiliensis]|uniref:SDR family NAD(P)-dependent oxidoreductase n=1 Tax=Holdemania massiliensis TaxID=1468449 RepID=A0A6N7SA90_9FIRM|nr:SDR family NAD(P)-dependent oxidoreductase [Holdemania massiliensis]MSA90530.1 SDR family NAD(P)-dependent oxidoreductase [Holdemania massiliensis]MSB79336.1 SDR family NAD(P)-dependent oxidoreductase [Holdemania massiliensis]MSC34260.1 SDR family NAD(P)-dependent oxidoreductase [Holdemania massiliensis]MSC40650.1 SDR family NAD(P)-dependent oxidoreductase [Holdemania massiliensis]